MSDLLPEVICEPEPAEQQQEETVLDVEEPEAPQVKEVIEDEFIFKDAPKKQRSAKQMEHLKVAREKALATRRANKARREKAEAEARGEEYVPKVYDKPASGEQKTVKDDPPLKKVEEQKHDSKTYESVARAIHRPNNPDPEDVWALCFN